MPIYISIYLEPNYISVVARFPPSLDRAPVFRSALHSPQLAARYPASLSICPHILYILFLYLYLSIYLSIWLYVQLSVFLSYLSLSIFRSIYQYIKHVFMYIYQSNLSMDLSRCLASRCPRFRSAWHNLTTSPASCQESAASR